MYTIINKIELEEDNNLKYTDFGYTTDETIINQINKDYDTTLGYWVETNKEELENGTKFISEFFDTTSLVYVARTGVNYSVSLPEITDINQL
jgi:hypothetical protein